MRNPDKPKVLRSWEDCMTMEDYNRYRRQKGTVTSRYAYASEAQRRAEEEAYQRCLKNDSIKYWKGKKNKEA